MIVASLLAQASLLVRPTYPTEEPPELRSAQHILLLHAEVADVHPSVTQGPERAVAFARELLAELAAGADFTELARRHSMARSAASGAVLGTFAPGMLAPELDAFLFAADPGEVSPPIATASGVHGAVGRCGKPSRRERNSAPWRVSAPMTRSPPPRTVSTRSSSAEQTTDC
jgi:peptidyl-prolyl cis-trans isomerase C